MDPFFFFFFPSFLLSLLLFRWLSLSEMPHFQPRKLQPRDAHLSVVIEGAGAPSPVGESTLFDAVVVVAAAYRNRCV